MTKLLATDLTADAANTVDFDGFAVRETGSAAAVVNFRDTAVDGQILLPLNLAADQSAAFVFDEQLDTSTVYVQVVSGDIEGVFYSRVD